MNEKRSEILFISTLISPAREKKAIKEGKKKLLVLLHNKKLIS